MNATYKLRPRFKPETRFKVVPVTTAPQRGLPETALEQLKARLLEQVLGGNDNPRLQLALRHAVNDAAAIAWTTPFGVLFLPELVNEKVAAARRQAMHQEAIRRGSRMKLKGDL